MSSARSWAIRVSAFPRKELGEIVRQPLLVLSLVLGPSLILLLFGATLRDTAPTVRALFVAPRGSPIAQAAERFAERGLVGSQLVVEGVSADLQAALERLREGEVGLVVDLPGSAEQAIRANEQARIVVYHNRLDPIENEALRVFTLQLIDQVNRQVLAGLIGQVQERTAPVTQRTAATLGQVTAVRQALERAARQLEIPGALTEALRQVRALEEDLGQISDALEMFTGLRPEVIVSPFAGSVQRLGTAEIQLADFYAPAAVALLLQHLVMTFVGLSIVREDQQGATELFRVAPLSTLEALLGKYLAYLIIGGVIGSAVLILLVAALGVPMAGSWPLLASVVAALLYASIGFGFIVALVSKTDSQAVQYAMIVLLASIFFSGFLLTLDRFAPPLPALARLLPVTYGVEMLRDVMLRGQGPDPRGLLALFAMGALLQAASWGLLRRRLSRR